MIIPNQLGSTIPYNNQSTKVFLMAQVLLKRFLFCYFWHNPSILPISSPIFQVDQTLRTSVS